jgi:hypothetical protein
MTNRRFDLRCKRCRPAVTECCARKPGQGAGYIRAQDRVSGQSLSRCLESFFSQPAPRRSRESFLKFRPGFDTPSVAKQKRTQQLMRGLVDRRRTEGDRHTCFQSDGSPQQLFRRWEIILLLGHQTLCLVQQYLGSDAVGRIGVVALPFQIDDGVGNGFEFDDDVARGCDVPSGNLPKRACEREVELRAGTDVCRHRPAGDLATPISRLEQVA